MPNLSDASYKKMLKEVSTMIGQLTRQLEYYVEDEENVDIKNADRKLIEEARTMEGNIDDAILKMAISGR